MQSDSIAEILLSSTWVEDLGQTFLSIVLRIFFVGESMPGNGIEIKIKLNTGDQETWEIL